MKKMKKKYFSAEEIKTIVLKENKLPRTPNSSKAFNKRYEMSDVMTVISFIVPILFLIAMLIKIISEDYPIIVEEDIFIFGVSCLIALFLLIIQLISSLFM